MELERSAGILLHITSLPGDYGIGDLGAGARRFVDWLSQAGQRWWQVLPLGPLDVSCNPYSSSSSWAGAEELLDLEHLVQCGDLRMSEIRAAKQPGAKIRYDRVRSSRARLLALAAERFFEKKGREYAEYEKFCARERWWLDSWAMFSVLRTVNRAPWWKWPRPLAMGDSSALRKFSLEHAALIHGAKYRQFRFEQQWQSLKEYAAAAGVRLIGDLPIYCPRDSQDVWAARDMFKFDRGGRMIAQSGVPPDYFSATGQLWGTPVYDWAAHKANRFAWWIDRLRGTLRRVDLLRLDHFRALHDYWEVPASAKTAKKGRWQPGPGDAFLTAVSKRLGTPFIAEDLGMITEGVYDLRDRWDLPGMRVLQFAFGGGSANIHLPHHYVRRCIVYTGTHDNDTTVGWFKKAGRDERAALRRYVGHTTASPNVILMRLAFQSVADLAIVPMQDVLGLGSEARQNLPGAAVKGGNFRWKLAANQLSQRAARELRELTETYGRA